MNIFILSIGSSLSFLVIDHFINGTTNSYFILFLVLIAGVNLIYKYKKLQTV